MNCEGEPLMCVKSADEPLPLTKVAAALEKQVLSHVMDGSAPTNRQKLNSVATDLTRLSQTICIL